MSELERSPPDRESLFSWPQFFLEYHTEEREQTIVITDQYDQAERWIEAKDGSTVNIAKCR